MIYFKIRLYILLYLLLGVEEEIDIVSECIKSGKPDIPEHDSTTKLTIKEASPFTQIFRSIYENVSVDLETNDIGTEPNPLFFSPLIKILLDRFMPYAFIWTGLVLRGTKTTRWTNGTVERFIRTQKATDKKLLRQPPAEYVMRSKKKALGLCIEYQDSCVSLLNINKKRKVAKDVTDGNFTNVTF